MLGAGRVVVVVERAPRQKKRAARRRPHATARPPTMALSGAAHLNAAFAARAGTGSPAFIAFLTAGYPALATTVPAMAAMDAAGVDIIELGVPFSDPMADGGTIAKANHVALANGVTLAWTLDAVRAARAAGVRAPVVLMGYLNPLLAYGAALAADAAAAGVAGFIVVDLPPDDAGPLRGALAGAGLALVPLVAPTTADARLARIGAAAASFVYCVSVTGVTGARADLPPDLGAFVARVRAGIPRAPLAVGFGLSTRAHVDAVAKIADGVVMGSAIVRALEKGGVPELEKLLADVVPPRAA